LRLPPVAEELLRLLSEHLGSLGTAAAGPSSSAAADTSGEDGSGDGGGVPGGDFGVPAGMASLVDSIMQQLLSKEVLYQPMQVGQACF
jgi:hypothetical protein